MHNAKRAKQEPEVTSKWSVQASEHTYTQAEWSHTSVGLARLASIIYCFWFILYIACPCYPQISTLLILW